jgi:hypothetical protein
VDLPPSNFVVEDAAGRFWVTVSTGSGHARWATGAKSCNDGFVVMVDTRGARIVADGLGYTNEVRDPSDGQWLYVNETFSRRLSRFPVETDGSLGVKEVVTEFGAEPSPTAWPSTRRAMSGSSSIVSNRLIRVAPDGSRPSGLRTATPDHLAWVEAGLDRRHDGPRPHLDGARAAACATSPASPLRGPIRAPPYSAACLATAWPP